MATVETIYEQKTMEEVDNIICCVQVRSSQNPLHFPAMGNCKIRQSSLQLFIKEHNFERIESPFAELLGYDLGIYIHRRVHPAFTNNVRQKYGSFLIEFHKLLLIKNSYINIIREFVCI